MTLLLTTDALDPATSRFAFLAQVTLVLLVVAAVILWRRVGNSAPHQGSATWGQPARLLYGLLVVSVAVLSVTSLVSIWRYGAMHGWWLVAHMFAAGVFVATVTLVAVFLSSRFVMQARLASAITYVFLLVTSLLVMGSILLSMYPLFGTEEMLRLIAVHRYSGLGLLAATVLHMTLVRVR